MLLLPPPANAVSPIDLEENYVQAFNRQGSTLSKSRSAMLSTPVSPSRKGTS